MLELTTREGPRAPPPPHEGRAWQQEHEASFHTEEATADGWEGMIQG